MPKLREGVVMVDPTEQEIAAMHAAMKFVAEIMEEIGWATRLADLSEEQVLTLIEVAVTAFQDAMRDHPEPEVPF